MVDLSTLENINYMFIQFRTSYKITACLLRGESLFDKEIKSVSLEYT